MVFIYYFSVYFQEFPRKTMDKIINILKFYHNNTERLGQRVLALQNNSIAVFILFTYFI